MTDDEGIIIKFDVEIDKKLENLSEDMKTALKDAVEIATNMVKSEAKDNILRGYDKSELEWKPISKSYREQLAKKKLLPHTGLVSPKNDKKKLEQSLGVKFKNGGLTGIITTDRPYAIYVEKGTSKMPARPFFQPALEKKKPEIERIIKDAIDKALR